MTALAPPTISVPFDPASTLRSVTPTISAPQELSAPPRFPHTRAQLTAIARQYRPLDNYDEDNDEGANRITSAFVNRVASLLEEEREDDLKTLLKDAFGPSIDDEEVRIAHSWLWVASFDAHALLPLAFSACTGSHASSP